MPIVMHTLRERRVPHNRNNNYMVIVGYRRFDNSPIEVPCGGWYSGETVLCDSCEKLYTTKYPQGWKYYPGDVCKHGTYVGGVGVDWMCGACESGD